MVVKLGFPEILSHDMCLLVYQSLSNASPVKLLAEKSATVNLGGGWDCTIEIEFPCKTIVESIGKLVCGYCKKSIPVQSPN